MSTSCEWNVLEKLLLTQAVHKYGENMWFQVARVLKQHDLLQRQQRQSDFFSQKNCQFQYYLLVENLEAEKQVFRSNDLLKNDMPVVVKIARQLYLQRIEELKEDLRKDEESFGQLAEEIESIKLGKWDQKLSESNEKNQEDVISKDLTVSDKIVETKEPAHETTVIENKKIEDVASLENRMKRTASETNIEPATTLKKCRLEESTSESNEDHVISTAISDNITHRTDFNTSPKADPTEKINQNLTQEETQIEKVPVLDMHNVPAGLETDEKIVLSNFLPETSSAIIPAIEPVPMVAELTSPADVVGMLPSLPKPINSFTMVTEAINMINMSNNIKVATEPSNKNTIATQHANHANTDTGNTNRDITELEQNKKKSEVIRPIHTAFNEMEPANIINKVIAENEDTMNTEAKNDDVHNQKLVVENTSTKEKGKSRLIENLENIQPKLLGENLPKIIIPESSLTYYDQSSASPISKINMTPDDEYYTGSETATPTSAVERKRSSGDQRQKAWQKNINLLWQEIANHKNGTMFMNPIKKSHAPLYDKVVKQPLYLKTIKNRVRDGIVKTTAEFERDVVLMLTNSLMYNKEGTEMYLMALEMLDDVREQIRLFKSADGYSVSLWENENQ